MVVRRRGWTGLCVARPYVCGAWVDARTVLKKTPRQSLAPLYFDIIVFDREQFRHLVNLWGADHVVVGTDSLSAPAVA